MEAKRKTSQRKPPRRYTYWDAELIDLAQRKAAERGGVLTLYDFCRLTGVGASTVNARFGGWLELRRAAGLEVRRSYSKRGDASQREKLMRVLEEAVKKYGMYITKDQFCQFAQVSGTTINTHCGGWKKLRADSGLKPRPRSPRDYPELQLFASLIRLVKEFGRFPTPQEIETLTPIPYREFLRRYGSHQMIKRRYEAFMERFRQACENVMKKPLPPRPKAEE